MLIMSTMIGATSNLCEDDGVTNDHDKEDGLFHSDEAAYDHREDHGADYD